MFASPAETAKSTWVRITIRYLLATIFCAAFGAVYELFSHGVYAYGMLYAFIFPLLGGVLPGLLFMKGNGKILAGTALQLWSFGISALTVGALFSGALEIYGTTSRLTTVYWLAGVVCLLLSVLTALLLPDHADVKTVANQ